VFLIFLAGTADPAAASVTCLTGTGQKAVRACTTVIEEKSSTQEMRILARRYRAAAYNELGKYRPAIADLNVVIEAGEALAQDWWQRGSAQYFVGDYAKAVSDLEKATTLSVDETLYAPDLAYALVANGQVDDAIAKISKIVWRNPDRPDLRAARGWAYYSANSLNAALIDYDKAVAGAPSNALWRNQRGLVREGLRDWQGAEADYGEAIKLQPRRHI
jgi:tetratricopeptide (TPR) repeat protein